MYSPSLRWERSARSVALARWASRLLMHATYSGEPGATLLARQTASSSPSRFATGTWPRWAQPEMASARRVSAMQSFAGLSCIGCFCLLSFFIAGLDFAIHQNKGIAWFVIARSASDEAIHSFFVW